MVSKKIVGFERLERLGIQYVLAVLANFIDV